MTLFCHDPACQGFHRKGLFICHNKRITSVHAVLIRRPSHAVGMTEYLLIQKIRQIFSVPVPLHVYGQDSHALWSAFAGGIHNGNRHIKRIGQDLLPDQRRLKQTALSDHHIRLDSFFPGQYIHPYF